MSFTLTRPPSPSPRDSHSQNGIDEEGLSSALHAAFQNITPSSMLHNNSHSVDHDMAKEKDKAHLEISVNSDTLYLKGTGVDVEPALLTGHIILHLTESTSFKEITLQFRGKAKLPPPATEPLSLNNNPLTYIVCQHDWSFLEGEKRHSHTLKAGRHLFPFQLQIGGSLPSCVATSAFGGASIIYKLRAVAVRPGLSTNFQSMIPIHIIRSFAPEALEYQQTLEIENTWPDKLMYSIMIPHKAWAAGDVLTALVKFQPLAKGARVLNVTTTINETTKLTTRGGQQEHTRSVSTAKHEIVAGRAVPVEEYHHRHRVPLFHASSHTSTHGQHSPHSTSQSTPTTPHAGTPPTSYLEGGLSTLTLAGPSSTSSHTPNSNPDSAAASTVHLPVGGLTPDIPEGMESQDDVVTHLSLTIPLSVTPSHGLEPIIVSHRVRWSILIANLDGHTSELRCSLPVHVLDYRLLDEARAATAATRRLLLGGPEVPAESSDDAELPSYPSHVRDRVANMFLPEAATMRVTNPWVHSSVSPTYASNGQGYFVSAGPSGANSPLEAHPITSYLPPNPASGTSTPLDWVNSELLLSLSSNPPPELHRERQSPTESSVPSRASESTPGSHRPSRRQSRASSPERGMASPGSPSGSNETFVHSEGHASRNLHGIFSATMKPFTSLTHSSIFSRSHSHSNLASLTPMSQSRTSLDRQSMERNFGLPPGTDPQSSQALLHRAFTEVPDYGIASRGFIGGVPPLTSLTGLPSYEEAAERSVSDTDLAGRFARARGIPLQSSIYRAPNTRESPPVS